MVIANICSSHATDEDVRRYLPLVHRIASGLIRRLPASVLREDLVAAGVAGLLDALRKQGGYAAPTFEYYARVRIRGAMLDELRALDWFARCNGERRHAIVRIDDVGDREPIESSGNERSGDSESACMRADERRLLSTAVEHLPAREQAAIRMRYFEELGVHEIAQRMSVSNARVSQILARALGRLRETFDAMEAA